MRLPHSILLAAACVLGVSATEASSPTLIDVALPSGVPRNQGGRLLLFAERATAGNATDRAVDLGGDPGVSVAARDVASFGANGAVTIDADRLAFPRGFGSEPPGLYRVQAVLDVDGSYNYTGRGAGDLVSDVVTLRFPLASRPSIRLEHVVPPDPGQFDVTGLPPGAAAQITASRDHLHDERIPSAALTRFRGKAASIAAWVLTPPGYDASKTATYPTVYTAGGFGATHRTDGQQLSRQWHLMETGEIPPMIWVALDYATPHGTTEFADSACNGPWGEALVKDVIPSLEARYRMDAKPSGRFLTGHSSGGWFALSALARHPELFGGSWPTAPDPVDFHDFIGVDLYADRANMYRDDRGAPRPLERRDGAVRQTIEQAARLEGVLGHGGGQLSSFEWVFSPCRSDGTPAPLFNRESGAVDPRVARYWREHFDMARVLRDRWPRRRAEFDGKLHLVVGDADSFYLDGPARRMARVVKDFGGRADFLFVPGASHSMTEVYRQGGDRYALWKRMTAQMVATARPAPSPSTVPPRPAAAIGGPNRSGGGQDHDASASTS